MKNQIYMKNHILTAVLALILVFSAGNLSAQAQDNALKISTLNLIARQVPIAYERAINEKQSFAVMVQIGLPKNAPVNDIAGDVDGVGDIGVSGLTITPEYRFYVTGEAMDGFYVAPFLRYRNWGYDFEGQFGDDLTEVTTEGNWSAFGGGAQLGYQWLIGDHFVIDWYFLGLGLNLNRVNADFTTTAGAADLEQVAEDIREAFVDYPALGDQIATDITDGELSAAFNFLFPSFRTGISLGFAF
jgi:hypothetical protein